MRFAGQALTAPQPIQDGHQMLALNPKTLIINELKKDVMDRGVADGTLDAAAQSGLAPRGTYVDSVRPADSDKQFVDIMGSGFI